MLVISPNIGSKLNNTVIRHVEPDDYKVIIASVDEWWGGRRMAPMLPKLFFVHFRPTSFVAVRDGVIIGFVIGLVSQSCPDQGYIHFVGIHPNFRQGGLGHQLYERVFEAMIRNGCKIVRCVTSPVNKGSIAFHLRLGFEPEISDKVVEDMSVFEDYDGPQENRVLFSKRLDFG